MGVSAIVAAMSGTIQAALYGASERPNIDLAKLIGSTDPIYLLNLLVNCTIITINGC